MAERQKTETHAPGTRLLRAAAVMPMSGPPIRHAAIHVLGNRIAEITPWRDVPIHRRGSAIDLSEAVLLPGLINAHCHLDYTHMAGQLPPQESFTDWLKLIVSTKASWSVEDFARSWVEGAAMLLRSGTTTVVDIEAVPQLQPQLWAGTPLRVISFLEMIAISSRRPARDVFVETLGTYKKLRAHCFQLGLSPHSPYCTSPELLRLSARAGQRNRFPLTTHLAESLCEFRMFRHGGGEMFKWLQQSGRDMRDCGKGSPVTALHRAGMLGPHLLAAHVNYLSRGDATLLGQSSVNVVHCPRSHSYFKHRRFPLRKLARAGVNICLGTDSLASVYRRRSDSVQLDLFAEMRAMAQAQPTLSPRSILRMATVNGARALGLAGHIGILTRGALADMIALPMPSRGSNLYEAVVHHEGPVLASMIAGRWAIPPEEE